LIYFVIFIGFIEIYTKSENKASIFYYYKILLIYSLAILGLWLFVLVAWYILGLPIGVNVWPTA
ncbi:MAG: p-aminobenzoyl-glutamate transporter, partial [Bacilli bacterium]|nr:p-aminobenzoyl-glutamate transporter [Bacilli bacterium]